MNISRAKELLELGRWSSKKTKILILQALKEKNNLTYVSFDISTKALNMSYDELKNISPKLDIKLVKETLLMIWKKLKIQLILGYIYF